MHCLCTALYCLCQKYLTPVPALVVRASCVFQRSSDDHAPAGALRATLRWSSLELLGAGRDRRVYDLERMPLAEAWCQKPPKFSQPIQAWAAGGPPAGVRTKSRAHSAGPVSIGPPRCPSSRYLTRSAQPPLDPQPSRGYTLPPKSTGAVHAHGDHHAHQDPQFVDQAQEEDRLPHAPEHEGRSQDQPSSAQASRLVLIPKRAPGAGPTAGTTHP